MDRRDAIVSEIEKSLPEMTSLFKSLSPEELRTRVYSDGAQWTVKKKKRSASCGR